MNFTTHELDGTPYLEYRTGTPALDPLPCVLVLHWMAAQPQDMLPLLRAFPHPARLLLPFGFYHVEGGYAWFAADFYEQPLERQGTMIRATAERLADFLDALTRSTPCRGRPSVMGMSQGGDLSYALAVYHPAAIGAAFPLGARWLPEFCPAPATLPAGPRPAVWALHGEADPIVPVAVAQASVAWLQQHGFDARLQSYPEVGHTISAQMVADLQARLQQATR